MQNCTATCTFALGDGNGTPEKRLGKAASEEECVTMVRTQEPTANGVTFRYKEQPKPGDCYAEFGMTGGFRHSLTYKTCIFQGRPKPSI